MIDQAVAPFADPAVQMSTLRRRIDDPSDLASPHVVKVVVDLHDNALYFSRAPIPHRRDVGTAAAVAYTHIGLYVYRRRFLLDPAALRDAARRARMLEQLRVLEHGFRIKRWRRRRTRSV
jgi:3-deoxy-manno-octulosonate cytidylyltransferase (CMP-KDO synthetase)